MIYFSDNVLFIHADHLGTPRAITKASDNAKVWEWKNDDPFGANVPNENPSGLGPFAFNLRFPGQYYDQETGTHYNYFRDYDPGTGRYVQSDPMGLKAGINTFAYVGGTPISRIDPLGLQACGTSLFPGPKICAYYQKRCADSGGEDKYACEAKKCCESFGDNFFSNCTRKCLIDYDQASCSKLTGDARNSCRKWAHVFCYANCLNISDAIQGGFGLLVPSACKGAADSIGGMW